MSTLQTETLRFFSPVYRAFPAQRVFGPSFTTGLSEIEPDARRQLIAISRRAGGAGTPRSFVALELPAINGGPKTPLRGKSPVNRAEQPGRWRMAAEYPAAREKPGEPG
jgi:hypothetical protein